MYPGKQQQPFLSHTFYSNIDLISFALNIAKILSFSSSMALLGFYYTVYDYLNVKET